MGAGQDAPGTKLITDDGTGVFFENWNTNANWYQGFTGYIHGLHAIDYPGEWPWKDWDNDQILILNSSGQSVYNDDIITGSLVADGVATWYLDEILVAD